MGQYKNIFFTVGIHHTEQQLIVSTLAEQRIHGHIFQEIVHPAHIPLIIKSETASVHIACHHRISRRFLGYHLNIRVAFLHNRIEMFQKFNGFQILLAAINIRAPFTILSSIVQIEHRSHRIHTQSVNVILFNPIQCIGNEEVADFLTSVIKDQCSPVRMFASLRIRIFIERLPVKTCQSVQISWKMRRYPVKDHTDLMLMQIIYKIHKIFRCSVAGRRCVITGHLISPGSIQGMFHDRHQFHMCVSHIQHIVGDLFGQISVI